MIRAVYIHSNHLLQCAIWFIINISRHETSRIIHQNINGRLLLYYPFTQRKYILFERKIGRLEFNFCRREFLFDIVNRLLKNLPVPGREK